MTGAAAKPQVQWIEAEIACGAKPRCAGDGMELELLGGGASDGRRGMLSFTGALRVFVALEELQPTGDGGTTDRGDEERSECRRVLHKEVFRNGVGVLGGGVEFQSAVALPGRGDAEKRVSQTLDIADGRVRGRGDLGAKGAGCGAEGLRKLGWP